MDVEWPDKTRNKINFDGCIKLITDMNLNYAGPEIILESVVSSDYPTIEDIKKTWQSMGIEIGKIYCFALKTHSGSSFVVYARSFFVD